MAQGTGGTHPGENQQKAEKNGYEAGEYLRDFLDFHKLGEYIAGERDGEFLYGSFVCVEDGCDLTRIMGEDNHCMELGGMTMGIYPYSLEYAIKYNERDIWRESYQLNCDCARAVEQAIAENYDGHRLSGDCAKAVLGEYGIDRVNWVLANTIRERLHDGRFSRGNKEWAAGFTIPQDTTQLQFVVDSHLGLVNLFADTVRQAWQKMGLYDAGHCTGKNEDFEGKVLVLKPTILKDEYKTPDFQLFLAEGGFGCSATARGRKVYGRFLKDGEETVYNRQDFLGVLKDEHLPDWAREKLQEQAQDSGQEMA